MNVGCQCKGLRSGVDDIHIIEFEVFQCGRYRWRDPWLIGPFYLKTDSAAPYFKNKIDLRSGMCCPKPVCIRLDYRENTLYDPSFP